MTYQAGYQIVYDGSYTTVSIPTVDANGRPQMRVLKFAGRPISESPVDGWAPDETVAAPVPTP